MSNPTTPFNWQMPTASDLVTDLPADFEVFGQAVATSMADLLGGTTGQVLAKASNADMDFVWSADAAGMTNPMTTTGDVIYSSPGSTPVRLGIGSTGQGLAVVAGIPAWSATSTSTLTTTGDMLYASAANTLARVGVGSTGNVLTVAGGVPTWAAPAVPSSGLTLIKRASFSNVADTSTTFDSMFSSTYGAYQIVIETLYSNTDQTNDLQMQWRYAGPNTQTSSYNGNNQSTLYNSTTITSTSNNGGSSMLISLDCGSSTAPGSGSMLVTNAFGSSGRPKILGSYAETDAGRGCTFWQATTIDRTYTGFLLKASATNITGTVAVYGLAK